MNMNSADVFSPGEIVASETDDVDIETSVAQGLGFTPHRQLVVVMSDDADPLGHMSRGKSAVVGYHSTKHARSHESAGELVAKVNG